MSDSPCYATSRPPFDRLTRSPLQLYGRDIVRITEKVPRENTLLPKQNVAGSNTVSRSTYALPPASADRAAARRNFRREQMAKPEPANVYREPRRGGRS